MAKEIILYNLKPSVTDEEYAEYCKTEKGPFLESLPACESFTLLRITGSKHGEIPYRYVGIIELTDVADWQRGKQTQEFRDFLAGWTPKVADFHSLIGEEVYGGSTLRESAYSLSPEQEC